MARGRPLDLEALFARIVDEVREHGSLPAADLKVARRHFGALTPRLVASGLEVGSNVRLPLAQQLGGKLRQGFALRKGLERAIKGATGREIDAEFRGMVERGEAVVVLRESGAGFVAPTVPALAAGEIDELLRCLKKVEALARRARAAKAIAGVKGVRAAVMRDDVTALLARFTAAPAPGGDEARSQTARPVTPGRSAAAPEQLTREILARLQATPRPVRVPELLRALHTLGASTADGQRALLDGAARGVFELQPESGMGRLSEADAALCPRGPMGTTLSWVSCGIARDGGASSS